MALICRDAVPVDAPAASAVEATHPWFAVRVRSNFEQMTAAALRGKGYEEFLPVYRARRRWSDRLKEVDCPLFPGYVFCRFDVENRLPVLVTPGVISILGMGKTPVPLDEGEIEAVRVIVRSGLVAGPWPFVRVGQAVYIEEGPLAGAEGVVIKVKGRYRLVASVTLLQRSVYVEIDREWVRPIPGRD